MQEVSPSLWATLIHSRLQQPDCLTKVLKICTFSYSSLHSCSEDSCYMSCTCVAMSVLTPMYYTCNHIFLAQPQTAVMVTLCSSTCMRVKFAWLFNLCDKVKNIIFLCVVISLTYKLRPTIISGLGAWSISTIKTTGMIHRPKLLAKIILTFLSSSSQALALQAKGVMAAHFGT